MTYPEKNHPKNARVGAFEGTPPAPELISFLEISGINP
jgi:hypothetical protein